MKTNLILIVIVLSLFFVSGCAQITNKCGPSYILDYPNNLLKEDVFQDNGTVGYRFFKEKQCLDGSTPQKITIHEPPKGCMDCNSEMVYYCEADDNYIVVQAQGGSFLYYLFEGKPRK